MAWSGGGGCTGAWEEEWRREGGAGERAERRVWGVGAEIDTARPGRRRAPQHFAPGFGCRTRHGTCVGKGRGPAVRGTPRAGARARKARRRGYGKAGGSPLVQFRVSVETRTEASGGVETRARRSRRTENTWASEAAARAGSETG